MAAVTGLTLVKRFPYRGDPLEEFSNTYHFKGGPPGDDPSWTVLMTDVVNLEKPILRPDVLFVRAYGYDSDDPHAHHVFAHDFTVPGPPPAGSSALGGNLMAGDQASLVWWKTDKLSSRGKPIYLRKYFHHGHVDTTSGDNLLASYRAALQNYSTAANLIHGGLRGRRQDSNVVLSDASPFVTTRTLKRRGKRPLPRTLSTLA